MSIADDRFTDSEKWLLLVSAIVLGWLIHLLGPVLTPFAAAALLAYLADPLVDRLERWKTSRTLAVVIVFLTMTLVVTLIVVILIPLLEDQIERLRIWLPELIAWIRDRAVPWLTATFGIEPELLSGERVIEMVRTNLNQAGGFAASLLGSVSRSGAAILAWIINLTLIPVVTFYLLRDWDKLVERVRQILPRHVEPTVSALARESDVVLGAFLRGQLTVMIALGLIYAIGLWLIGIDLALLIGLIAGLISFVPYLGTIVGVLLGVLAAAFQYQDFLHVALVLGVFGAGQLLEGMLLTPLLVGDRIGLHPVAVIFAVMAGGQLFGFVGVLLALPVAAVVNVVLRHLHKRYRSSKFYGRGQPVEPAANDAGAPAPE